MCIYPVQRFAHSSRTSLFILLFIKSTVLHILLFIFSYYFYLILFLTYIYIYSIVSIERTWPDLHFTTDYILYNWVWDEYKIKKTWINLKALFTKLTVEITKLKLNFNCYKKHTLTHRSLVIMTVLDYILFIHYNSPFKVTALIKCIFDSELLHSICLARSSARPLLTAKWIYVYAWLSYII